MKTNQVIHIMAGGPADYIPADIFNVENDMSWIGVDRGVYYLLEKGIVPDYAVGDFDSVSGKELAEIIAQVPSLSRFKPEKDETDMELALIKALELNPTMIKIYGATGGRLDHFIANALLLFPYQQNKLDLKIEIIDIQNHISIHLPGKHTVLKDDTTYISFIPLSFEVTGLTLNGFKYPLVNKTVQFGSSLCISNELTQQTGTFSFEKGILMMIRSIDLT